jgi:hypothetical protein
LSFATSATPKYCPACLTCRNVSSKLAKNADFLDYSGAPSKLKNQPRQEVTR